MPLKTKEKIIKKKNEPSHVLVGICGASGLLYAQRTLEILYAAPNVYVHAVASSTALTVALAEYPELTDWQKWAHRVYEPQQLDACVASGSFPLHGMIIAPCSLHTAMSLAAGLAGDLILRAGQVCLKERRPLVLLLRETPLATHHLLRLAELSAAGAVIMPAAPGFYHRPNSIDELVTPLVQRALAFLHLPQLPAPLPWNS